MINSRVLYFPWIDIYDEAWLKTSALFWDELYTIVPSGWNNPYSLKSAKELQEAKYLRPFFVNPDHRLVDDLADEVVKYLRTNYGRRFLLGDNNTINIHPQKLPRNIRNIIEVHPMKLPYLVRDMIERGFLHETQDEFIQVDERFGSFYMTLLAKNIAKHEKLSLLTPDGTAFAFSSQSLNDDSFNVVDDYDHHYYDRREQEEQWYRSYAKHLLLSITVRNFILNKDTPIVNILEFKKKYKDDLKELRYAYDQLIDSTNLGYSIAEVQENVRFMFENHILVSLEKITANLKDSHIKYSTTGLLQLTAITIGSGLLSSFGIPASIALAATAGISVTGTSVLCSRTDAKTLRDSPYSYLHRIRST